MAARGMNAKRKQKRRRHAEARKASAARLAEVAGQDRTQSPRRPATTARRDPAETLTDPRRPLPVGYKDCKQIVPFSMKGISPAFSGQIKLKNPL